MIAITIILLIVGLVVLVGGAEALVRGASSVSKKYGVSAMVIGLTIVSFGTSAPELVINLLSATSGSTDLAIGNILGSNIANILLILGICAMIAELKVQRNTTWKEIPFAGLAALVLAIMANDVLIDGAVQNVLTRTDGLIMIGFFVIFMYYTFELFKKGKDSEDDNIKVYSTLGSAGLIILGLAGLVGGGQLLVTQAVKLATMAGMSEMLIGLTVIAIGTSLPELATSVVAVMRKQTDMAIGNVIGSNIFNVFWILGLTSTITPLAISEHARQDIFINLALMIVLFMFIFIGKKHNIQRWQGVMLVLIYIVYTFFIVLRG